MSECQWRWLGEVVLRDPSVRCLLLLSTLPFLLRQPPQQQQQAAGVGVVEDWAGWDGGRSLRRLLRGLEAWKAEGQGREAVLLAAGGSQAVVTQLTLLPPHKGPDDEGGAVLPPPLCTQILCPSLSASGVGGGAPPVVVLAGSEGRLEGPGLSLAYKHIQVGEGGQHDQA